MFSKKDKEFYKEAIEPDLDKEWTKFMLRLQRFQKDTNQQYTPLEIGQKIIPLTVNQVENIGNILHSTWAEIRILSLVGDLVINGISPTFPIFGDWFFIKGSAPNMYDNYVMHKKVHNSELAVKVVKNLEKTRSDTYILDPVSNKEVYVSYNMEGLSRAIEIPMDFAEEEIILSENTLCSLTEHVGRTMVDQPNLMKDSMYAFLTGPVFTSEIWFSKCMFEFIYGIYSMNIKLGIIHGDLHPNNATLFSKRQVVDKKGDALVPNPIVIYDVHKELYVFPTTGRTSCIIDFSRSIINETSIIFDASHNKPIIIADQVRKILRIYERELPEFYNSYKSELKEALSNKYELVFKMFTAIDARRLCMGMASIVDNPKLLDILNKIIKISTQYLTTGMISVFKSSTEKVNWPMLSIIQNLFGEYTIEKYEKLSESTLIDYFSIDNEMKYNIREYDKFPPNIKLEYVVEHKIPVEQIGLRNYHKKIKTEKIEEEKVYELQESEKASKSARRGKPEVSEMDKSEKNKLSEELKETSDSFYYDT
jgi:hypothetical protein